MSTQSLAGYILAQTKKDGLVGELARSAERDAYFPREGGMREISRVLNMRGAPAEFHDALEEAEAEWRALH